MQLTTPLPAVADLERSFRFYRGLFEQEAVLDLGGNLSLSGGFALQQDFDRLAGIPKDSVMRRSNNMELYFETEDFDGFVARLSARKDIDYAHPPRKHPWQQRAVRIYAPDGQLIEVGESMRTIARRFHEEGRRPRRSPH
ncbi:MULTISPECIES: VOC family protein [unclassified Alistipes]|uniref:VOC family protein n=1 Tax=unclassified Alistipes TaxID=2608932 RepID=UPI0007A8EF18|nr:MULTISPECIES: VOC family protein [unclassified Alistipes]CVI67258.1 Glyoxalase-like domain protein [Alistipes sp. CHKCI003]HAW64609.1 glyoxalase [Alistipes sp.]HJC76418.1 glyoxalase/bleomycin resistance/dioxygenase family protein [Candidatus Alistipes excrementavium]